MDEKNTMTTAELEFVMDGITTRMQVAMNSMKEANANAINKMAESNKLLRSAVKYICASMLLVVIFVVAGFVIDHQIWNGYVRDLQERMVSSGVMINETIPQSGQGANDR